MNINNNLKYNNSDMQRLFTNSLSNKLMYNQLDCYYDSETEKWMVRNNLGAYEVWGVMPTVDDLDVLTTYNGKLAILSTDYHEYKWNGDEWIDLGKVGHGQIPVGWVKSNGSSQFDMDFDVRQIYLDNNYIKIQTTYNVVTAGDRIWDGGLDSDGGWFSLDSGGTSQYYNIGSTVYIDQNGIQKTYNTTDGWTSIEIKNGNLTLSNSDGQTYTRSINVTKSTNHNFSIFGRQQYHRGSYNLYNIKIWDSENADPIHDYYGSLFNNNIICIYDAIEDKYTFDSGIALTLTFTQTGYIGSGVPEEYPSQPRMSFYRLADSFSVINDNFNWDIDQTNEIVSNISEATKAYAYNTSDNKWYVKNDDGNYEEWGLMPTVDSLDDLTTYTGKLVILSTDSHEYKWTGDEWEDLGEGVNALVAITTNAVDKHGSVPEYKITKDGTDFILTGVQHDVECLVSFEKELRNGGDISNDAIVFNSETRSDSQEIEGFYALGNLYFDFSQSARVYFSGSSIVPNTQYTLQYTNGHYLGSQLGYANRQAFFLDRNNKGNVNKSSINNTNPNIKISSKYIDIYEIKIYDDNGLIYDLKPIDLNGTITLHDSINGINATLVSGEPIGVYDEDIPEHYPDKPAPTLRLTKPSYNNALNGSYLNGQKVTVYNNLYKVLNKFTTIPASISFENIHGSWELCEDSEHTKEGYNVMQSKDSYHVSNAYDLIKFTFNGITNLSILFGSYAESTFDYVLIGKLDTDCSNWNNGTNYTDSRVADYSFGRQSSTAPDRTYTFTNDAGEHYFYVMYKKDGSADVGSDRGYIGFDESIPINLPISTNKLLAFTALQNNSTIYLDNTNNIPNVYYSYDRLNWSVWDYQSINLTANQTIYFKGDNEIFNTASNYSIFKGTGRLKVSGSIMALVDNGSGNVTEIPANYGFAKTFYNNTALVDASDLNLNFGLYYYCYQDMFHGCTNLTEAPKLPMTTLYTGCYMMMFDGCTSLTKAPELPATVLPSYCYQYMFGYCTNLNEVTCNATTIRSYATQGWLSGVSSTGTFYKNANMESWTSGSNGIPSGWTVEDIVDRYIEFDKNPSDYKIYGWILRTDFDDVAQSQRGGDVNFGNSIGTSQNKPRMSAKYNNGVYTDNNFTDRRIQNNLPTLEYDGYSWYYYYFENTNGCYHQGYGGGQSEIDYYKTYMKFIIKPQQ